ncbi:MAG: choice-of-anchor D domain-containing protein, partial [Pirellulales bacterium]
NTPTGSSWLENVVGSAFDDMYCVAAQAVNGDAPAVGPPAGRNVDGSEGSETNGDQLLFNGVGRAVIDTGASLTTPGTGSVSYQNFEGLVSYDAAPRIIDNGDRGFTADPGTTAPIPNHWSEFTGLGLAGDILSNAADGRGDTATWTFGGLTPGLYRVSVTNPSQENLATAARFSVFDDGVFLGMTPVDQNSGPNDFDEGGASWEDLGVFEISSHKLVVELSDASELTKFVVADGVRVQAVGGDVEIRVRRGNEEVTDAISDVNLDTTLNRDLEETFTVSNESTASGTLQIAALSLVSANPITLGGPLVDDLAGGAVSLAPGESTTFTVSVDAGNATDFGGTVSLRSGDADENVAVQPNGFNEFTFEVSGEVSNVLIIDNGDPGYSEQGSWDGPDGDGYQGDDRFSGTGTATWTFENVPAGNYRVSATWSEEPAGQAGADLYGTDRAQFRVAGAAAASPVAPAVHNQQLPPSAAANSFADQGVIWADLGGGAGLNAPGGVHAVDDASDGIVGNGRGTLVVSLSDVSGDPQQTAIADAVRIECVHGADLVVSSGGSEVADGTGVVDFGSMLYGQSVSKTLTLANDAAGTDAITIDEPTNLPAGFAVVSFDGQTPTGGRSATLQPGEQATLVIRFDAGATGQAAGEVSMGSTDADENPFDFQVRATVATTQIIDNGGAGYQQVSGPLSDWQGPDGDGHLGDDAFILGHDGNPAAAVWTFTNLEAGTYQLSGSWKEESVQGGAPNAPFAVAGTNLANPAVVTVNQASAPDGFQDQASYWQDLEGPYTITA